MILREKILLGVVGLAVIGAGVVYAPALLSPPVPASKRAAIDFAALASEAQLKLKEGAPTFREKRVLAAATTEWARNPLRKQLLIEDVPVAPVAPPEVYVTPLPQYVGFLDIGGHLIAIIDGQDYRAGETIQGGEFKLLQIHSDHIDLLRIGAADPVMVPLEKPLITGRSQATEKSKNSGLPQ